MARGANAGLAIPGSMFWDAPGAVVAAPPVHPSVRVSGDPHKDGFMPGRPLAYATPGEVDIITRRPMTQMRGSSSAAGLLTHARE